MKVIISILNRLKLIRYSLLSESKKVRCLKNLRSSLLESNRIAKALEQTGDYQRSFIYSSISWAKMSEYCMYCQKEGLDVRETFKKNMKE